MWIKKNQQKIALIIGYVLVALLFYNLGAYEQATEPPEITVEEPPIDLTELQINHIASPDSSQTNAVAGETVDATDCPGQIKGNIGSSGKIYHMPGGAFYERTKAELCFDTEKEAESMGFRKSSR